MTARRAGTTATVALRGDDGDVGRAAEAAGATVVDEDAGDGDLDAVVIVGESALLALADDPPDVPVLPVDAGMGRYSVPSARAEAAIEALGSERTVRFDQPVLRVRIDGEEVGRALADATLMTSNPGRISEYAIRVDGEPIDTFRADGVVAATPLGSDGYSRAAGGSVLGPGTGVGVVPVSPFATQSNAWVLRPPLSLSVERDEGSVSLFLDGREQRLVGPADRIRIDDDGPSIRVALVRGLNGREWKNSNE